MEYGYFTAQRGVRRGVIVAQKTQNGIDRYAMNGIILCDERGCAYYNDVVKKA